MKIKPSTHIVMIVNAVSRKHALVCQTVAARRSALCNGCTRHWWRASAWGFIRYRLLRPSLTGPRMSRMFCAMASSSFNASVYNGPGPVSDCNLLRGPCAIGAGCYSLMLDACTHTCTMCVQTPIALTSLMLRREGENGCFDQSLLVMTAE
jgi:hypothetical protein